MLRIVCCVCVALILTSCEKNWRRLHIEKRVYRNGYYVHVPWERHSPVNSYPKPQPYPVDHSKTAQTDSTRKNTGGIPATATQSTTAKGAPLNNSPTVNGNYGNGGYGGGSNANGAPVPPPSGNGGTPGVSPAPNPAPVASAQPAPPLQYEPDYGSPPLQRPYAVPPVAQQPTPLPPDSSIAAKDSLPADDDSGFPEGELSLVTELGFYNPIYTGGLQLIPGSYNGGASIRYGVQLFPRHKFSGEGGIFVSQFFVAQDQHKFSPLFLTKHDHERMMQWKCRFMLMDHIYVTRKERAGFNAIELGMFSELSFFSTHVAIDNRSNINDAALTRNKSRLFGLHYLHHVQFGTTARIANEVWSVFANYRFTQLIKGNPDGGDLPALVVGATFALSE